MSTQQQNDKTRTITLTDRPPVKIRESEWPILASASGWSHAAVRVQANEEWRIYVRQHSDGRALVYGVREEGNGGMPQGYEPRRGGALLPAGADLVAAIRRVGTDVGIPETQIRECIADLPAEEI